MVNEKINSWTFEETVKTAENLMKNEKNIFKWDVLRHLKDFAETYQKEIQQYRTIGTVEECRAAVEKQTAISRELIEGKYFCPKCHNLMPYPGYCGCGQKKKAYKGTLKKVRKILRMEDDKKKRQFYFVKFTMP